MLEYFNLIFDLYLIIKKINEKATYNVSYIEIKLKLHIIKQLHPHLNKSER